MGATHYGSEVLVLICVVSYVKNCPLQLLSDVRLGGERVCICSVPEYLDICVVKCTSGSSYVSECPLGLATLVIVYFPISDDTTIHDAFRCVYKKSVEVHVQLVYIFTAIFTYKINFLRPLKSLVLLVRNVKIT